MFLPATNILKFSKILHILIFLRFIIIIIIIIIIFILLLLFLFYYYYLFIYLWNNRRCKMQRHRARIDSINHVREGAFDGFKG